MVESGGAQVIALSDRNAFIEAMMPVYGRFANTPKLQDMVKRIQAAAQ